MLKKNKAFTITELVIVIAVIAILAAVMIPTFSGVIESAKVSTDTANAGILSTELKVALMNSEETITEANAHRLLKEEFAAGKSGGIVPQSEGYGYHFVYNFNNGTIEVKHISEITKSATQSLNVGNGGVDLSNWGNVPETCFLNNGYFLLDTAGSALAEVVNEIYTVETVDNLESIVDKVENTVKQELEAVATNINAYLDTVVFVGNGGNFTTATDTSNVDKIVFTPDVTEITSVVNTVGGQTFYVDETHPLATLPNGTVLEIPATVNKISNNALTFNEGVTIHFEGTLEETVDGLDIGFTNCNFTFGDDNTVYHLSPDGTQIHDAEENVIDTLTAQYNVKSFTIKMSGDVDGTTMFSVALDDKADSYQFVTYNFVNTNDGAIVSNTNVTWSIESSSSDGASITADGLLTFSKAGEIVVKATSK